MLESPAFLQMASGHSRDRILQPIFMVAAHTETGVTFLSLAFKAHL
jgi:hypothetical protein